MEKPHMQNPKFAKNSELAKVPTGIQGFDEITFGGVPRGRPILVTGGAGSGKTLFGMQFLVRGALDFGEPGLFMSFEESQTDLIQNFTSLGFDLDKLTKDKKLVIDHVHIERSEIEETGEYDLEGLFIRIGFAIDSIGAKRVVLDTLESLFAGFANDFILRSELRRLFRWLKNRGVTVVITAERRDQENAITRHGLEEYVSDCVVVLDHRMQNQISTRRLRVMKYRGSSHGTNEYPFLIDQQGLAVLPITSVGLDYAVSSERVSTGIANLDAMIQGGGVYRGSSILVSGTAGTGKTSLAAHFADETCQKGQRCLYYSFEESSQQIIRNMRSIGIDLEQWVNKGLLQFQAIRPTYYGLETHLTRIHQRINEFNPAAIVMDPVSNLIAIGNPGEVKVVLMRLVDLFKDRLITSLFTSLTLGADEQEETNIGVSSLMDTWILLKNIENGGERNRGLYIIKSRGISHSNKIRELLLTDAGMELVDVYFGPDGTLTGTARIQQESREQDQIVEFQQQVERNRSEFEHKRQMTEARMAIMRAQLEAEEKALALQIQEHESKMTRAAKDRKVMARQRTADSLE